MILNRILAGTALLLAVSGANAAFLTFSDYAAWQASAGVVTGTQNFDGLTPTLVGAGADLGSGITVSSSGSGYGPWAIEAAPGLSNSECDVDGSKRLCGFNGHVLNFTFGGGIAAFSADFSSLNDGMTRTRFALYNGATLLATLDTPTVAGQLNQFWGFVATGGEVITSFRTVAVTGDTFGMDNLSIAAGGGTVPEPTSLALMGLGLLAAGVARRRGRL